ncbi:MAG: HAMP domain-containing histidine kinase, partial [Ilumatobacteraceae bacterium]|nr:HAMP domain-containing histidine kinase [Ilumatobacteraceae bacterium]
EIYESLRREREMVSKLHSMAELRTEFVQNVSHEMRTPLTNILGYTELLLLGDLGQLDAQQLKTMTVVEINGRRLLDLVDDLLMLTRFDANPVHAEQSEIDLTEVIEGALETIRPVAERARVTVTFDLEPGLLVMGNVPQLERVAINILSNAVKFTPCDGLINIGLTRAEDAVLTICDTGVGIPSDDLERVFDRFFRAENALEQAIPGTGLGLIIAREILDAHDGSITLESEIGRGTAVTITIPRVDSRVGANEVATDAQSAALIEST